MVSRASPACNLIRSHLSRSGGGTRWLILKVLLQPAGKSTTAECCGPPHNHEPNPKHIATFYIKHFKASSYNYFCSLPSYQCANDAPPRTSARAREPLRPGSSQQLRVQHQPGTGDHSDGIAGQMDQKNGFSVIGHWVCGGPWKCLEISIYLLSKRRR